MTLYSVNNNLRPIWGSARKIDVSKEVDAVIASLRTPEAVAKDAAAEGRQSTSQRGIEVATVGVIAKAAEENIKPVESLSDRVASAIGIDPGLVLLVLVVLILVYLYRERLRKMFMGRKTSKMLDLMHELPVEEIGKTTVRELDTAEAAAIEKRISDARSA